MRCSRRSEKKYFWSRPIFLKISSHLSVAEVDAILTVAGKYPFVTGFVVANLSKDRAILHLRSSQKELDIIPLGGISGAPLKQLSTAMIRHIYKKTGGKYILIGLGGVFTAEDAYEKIKAGASLVQMVTGLIYGGPMAIKRINKGLVSLLARDGYATVADAVGKSVIDLIINMKIQNFNELATTDAPPGIAYHRGGRI